MTDIPTFSHPLIRQWFAAHFAAPTEAQAQGWQAIAQGRHTLIAAPTGSGKTLAAFLTCVDSLVRQGLEGCLPRGVQVVYVSPLKALSNDIHRNLEQPLQELAALAQQQGTPLPEIRVAVRTGDTPASQRARMAKEPPHILITTPESLYILLTSDSGRKALRSVRTLILDELHAVVESKRGSHLSISVERLCALADGPVTRIGLSATQRPIEEMARFLVGNADAERKSSAECAIVDSGHRRQMDLALELPAQRELGPIATHEQWDETLDRIAELVRQHGTTLVFVNTRRLVERVAYQLALRLGDEAVVAHHGSLSQRTRRDAERRLKAGEVKVCVATSSLELGIDVGAVDLVCQAGSPRSIGLLLQRVGRSGHSLGGLPKGRLFPLTRDELLECMALVRGIRRGNLDTLHMPPWPLDVLAQQIVAECSCKEWGEEALYDLVRRAYPYRDLPRERYAQVLEMLSEGVAPREGRRGAYLHRDAVNGVLRPRRNARLAALTSGGAIPDNSDYDVILEPENTFVGTVNEDFAVESQKGDVFLLGNTPWRILRVESGRLRVEDAHGLAPSAPFWLGEAPGRSCELSDELSDLREEIYQRLSSGESMRWLMAEGFSREAADQAVAYIAEGVRVLGTVPTKRRIVAERFFDESGGMQLVIHAPFGFAVNRAWGMALRKQICRTFDFELQAAATNDGINFSLGPSLSFPLADVFRYIQPDKAQEVATQAVLQSPVFGLRWRWAASRALALLRFSGGRKVPPPLLRMRSGDLLAAVFPAQVQCQDNAMPGDIEVPEHPLVFEAMRDCLTEAMDIEALRAMLARVYSGDIEVYARDTTQPSVFSHQILNAMPYAFLDNAPLEERRSRAVALRRALPEDARELGALDPQAIDRAAQDAWPLVRDADELHDALLTLGLLPERDIGRYANVVEREQWQEWFAKLRQAGRATAAAYGSGRTAWVATERMGLVAAAFPEARFEPALSDGNVDLVRAGFKPAPTGRPSVTQPIDQEEARFILVRSRTECSGPFTAGGMAGALGLDVASVNQALARLEGYGGVLRGYFLPGVGEEQWCDRRVLARIHRDTIATLRKEVEPVATATFLRFLLRWQGVHPLTQRRGADSLLDVVEQLQGYEAAAGAWESDLLPARVKGYSPVMLDEACLSGEVVWGRPVPTRRDEEGQPARGQALSRHTPITLALRESLPWLLERPDESGDPPGVSGEVLQYLRQHGASFLPEIIAATRQLPSAVEETLWQLAAAGYVTADGFGAVRGLASGVARQVRQHPRLRQRSRQRLPSSRWSALASPVETPADDALESKAFQLLVRYGVLFPELLARETSAPHWRELLRVYRRAEARGEIRGGRFVAGFIGEQFALPEAVEQLRLVRKQEPDGSVVVVSACDPLNLAGVLTPGPRVPALPGNRLAYQDGAPVAFLQNGELHWLKEADAKTSDAVAQGLRRAAKELAGATAET